MNLKKMTVSELAPLYIEERRKYQCAEEDLCHQDRGERAAVGRGDNDQ